MHLKVRCLYLRKQVMLPDPWSYCTVYTVVQHITLFQRTLFNNNQALSLLSCYANLMLICFIPKKKSSDSCCTFVLIIIYGFDL